MVSISKSTKQTLMGGIAASVIDQAESGMSWFVAGYPQFLKNKLNPALPRNGALVAEAGTPAVAYVLTRKRVSERGKNLRTGIFLYDLPTLLHSFVYNAAYQAGLPATVGMSVPMRLTIPTINPVVNRMSVKPVAMAVTGAGKYGLVVSTPKTIGGSGIGRYR